MGQNPTCRMRQLAHDIITDMLLTRPGSKSRDINDGVSGGFQLMMVARTTVMHEGASDSCVKASSACVSCRQCGRGVHRPGDLSKGVFLGLSRPGR